VGIPLPDIDATAHSVIAPLCFSSCLNAMLGDSVRQHELHTVHVPLNSKPFSEQ
jgi:hypothetical protein